MSQKNIKISIGGRVYPLTITEKEEPVVVSSSKMIEENIVKLKEQYSIKDSQDLLAMTALEFATKMQSNINNNSQVESSEKEDNSEEVNQELDSVLELLDTLNL